MNQDIKFRKDIEKIIPYLDDGTFKKLSDNVQKELLITFVEIYQRKLQIQQTTHIHWLYDVPSNEYGSYQRKPEGLPNKGIMNIITVNMNVLPSKRGQTFEIASTIVHELVHQKQQELIDQLKNHSLKNIFYITKAVRYLYNSKHYIAPPIKTENEKEYLKVYKAYKNQLLEREAFANEKDFENIYDEVMHKKIYKGPVISSTKDMSQKLYKYQKKAHEYNQEHQNKINKREVER